MHSFKHRAAKFLMSPTKLKDPLHRSFHIYTEDDKLLTLETLLNSPPMAAKTFHIYDAKRKRLTLDKVLKGPMVCSEVSSQ